MRNGDSENHKYIQYFNIILEYPNHPFGGPRFRLTIILPPKRATFTEICSFRRCTIRPGIFDLNKNSKALFHSRPDELITKGTNNTQRRTASTWNLIICSVQSHPI